ncbi:TetR/AcrR family transcriptional regulator [Microbacteriaceae bacterium K1510]|nr:TetR/AcrR family transcriptional regulator [Microbacteriaceae bacterium K1510]
MRVSRVQAEENRQNVINVASRLFRERGFDGIGLKDLMESAGLTQGAFYKQFESKEDLAAQASMRAVESAFSRWSAATAANPDHQLAAILRFYLSAEHREEKADGCPIAALGADAARQGGAVKAAFETGIKAHLEVLSRLVAEAGSEEARSRAMTVLSTMVGAVTLSRIVNDPDLAQGFLDAAAQQVLSEYARKTAASPK